MKKGRKNNSDNNKKSILACAENVGILGIEKIIYILGAIKVTSTYDK